MGYRTKRHLRLILVPREVDRSSAPLDAPLSRSLNFKDNYRGTSTSKVVINCFLQVFSATLSCIRIAKLRISSSFFVVYCLLEWDYQIKNNVQATQLRDAPGASTPFQNLPSHITEWTNCAENIRSEAAF